MTPAPYRNEALAGRLLFILTLWLSLSVALLSALAPLGPPSSRFTGSAFNPATTSVVLKARAHASPVAMQAMEPDGDGRASWPMFAVGVSVVVAMLLAVVLPYAGNRFPRSSFSFPPLRLLSLQRARAPPVLF